MNFAIGWGSAGPTVKRSNTCESCGQTFSCELSLTGCWCSKVPLSDAARTELRMKYRDCLCPACLERYPEVASEDARVDVVQPDGRRALKSAGQVRASDS